MNRSFALIGGALTAAAFCALGPAWGQSAAASQAANQTALSRAIRSGDTNSVRSLLQQGANPDAMDAAGRRPLIDAVDANQTAVLRVLLTAGARVNAATSTGKTALIAAAELGRLEAARLLIDHGANLDLSDRGAGTALEAAERAGHTELAAMLRGAGAKTFGRSVGDTVCVRPWSGDGYCGTVESIAQNEYRIRLTSVVGCAHGCSARPDCSAGKTVGGAQGLHPGDSVAVPGSCLTHTGVRP
jgi:hypothetical protein